ncbi:MULTISPECIES: DUF3131 domain-containing protein [unclassified Mesorhizobium]|uniref:DUF3131 domain-containing protein n=1 Tax=unclassified Mesorhizobium TaxID=325217 RepID=UPI001129CCD6|nr:MULTISPECIES: DUF3131 domain-containing protein [unclassified Mesorhizobium]TPK94817.1 DUF3131 domain-containing protein [Mesorhizobium sp. B2-4-16]TPL62373.1 DUF3131 domain-containing protein [Mesorhizobium sp. B2-4-3]
MTITRRSVLLGGIGIPLLAVAGRGVATAAARLPNPLIVTVSGVGARADTGKLEAVANAFSSAGLPIAMTIKMAGDPGDIPGYSSGLAKWIRQSVELAPNAIEFGIHATKIAPADPYLQARQAGEMQAAFSHMINAFDRYKSKAVITALTLTTNQPLQSPQDAASMRSAGIRTVIRLAGEPDDKVGQQPPDGGYWMTNTGLVNTVASARTSATSGNATAALTAPAALARNIAAFAANIDPIIVEIPFDALAGLSNTDAADYASGVAKAGLAAVSSGTVRVLTPQKLYTQSRAAGRRYIVVRVDDLRLDSDTDPSHMAFVKGFIEAGYPVTNAIIPAPKAGPLSADETSKAFLRSMLADPRYDIAGHGWHHTPSELLGNSLAKDVDLIRDCMSEIYRSTGRLPLTYIPPNDDFDDNTLDAVAGTGTPMFAAEKGNMRWFNGLDRRGILHVSNTVKFEAAWTGDLPYFSQEQVFDYLGEDNDAVFCIHPDTAKTPEKKHVILDSITRMAAMPGTTLVNFAQYYKAVCPAMPKVDRIRQARADVSVKDWTKPDPYRLEEEALRADAELAWTYFDWGARHYHGMAPATSWIESGKQTGYPFVTMWDIGSHILAAVSAQRLRIIDQAEFEKTIDRILAFLGQGDFSFAGAKLPNTERRLSSKGGERDGFDSADTGRLLVALKVLDSYTEGAFPVFKLVRHWSFGPVLEDGEMHVVSDSGKISSGQYNSYAGYAGRGYSLWGEAISPVFGTADPSNDMDAALAAMVEIQRRGRIATEPHVTEEVELGASPHGRLMADILYAAQMKRFQETGILTCVSESAMAGPPYFTYQGYQLTDDGGTFPVDTLKTSAPNKASKLSDSLRLVNSKGAYLWLAARPGDYAQKLVTYVRERARMKAIGFSAGVSERTGKRIEVTDINTNGIILESVAYILGGRKPLLWRAEA